MNRIVPVSSRPVPSPFRYLRQAAGLVALALVAAGCSGGQQVTAYSVPGPDQSVNIASLDQVIAQNPQDAGALNVRGTAYGRSGDFDRAIADFSAAIALNPAFHQAYNNRALVYRRLNQTDKALADFNQAIAIAPDYAPAYLGRGTIQRQRKQYGVALSDFDRAIELQGNLALAYHNRALVYQAQGQNDVAIGDFSTAINLDPDAAAEPYHGRALSYYAIGNQTKAMADLEIAVRLNANYAEAWATRGMVLEALGRASPALESYERALVLDARNPIARAGSNRLRGQGLAASGAAVVL